VSLADLPQRRRLTPDARRAELLRAGERVFTDAAYEDVSIEQIADAAGVSKNLLYHYFSGKRDLYLETIRAATSEMVARTEPDLRLPPIERLRASIDQHLVYVQEHAEGYIKLLRGAPGDAEVQAIITAARRRVVERTVASLPSADTDPALVVALHGWVGFIDEVSLAWLEHPALSREDLREMLVHQFVGIISASRLTEPLAAS
jgi:AcrR family transcriptional regulator